VRALDEWKALFLTIREDHNVWLVSGDFQSGSFTYKKSYEPLQTIIDFNDASTLWRSHGHLAQHDGYIFGVTDTVSGQQLSHDVGFVTTTEREQRWSMLLNQNPVLLQTTASSTSFTSELVAVSYALSRHLYALND